MAIKICVDIGHYAGYNKGAYPGYYEGNQMWKLGQYLIPELRAYGFTVVETRTNISSDLALYNRGAKAKGCDLFISLHSNSCDSSSVKRVVIIKGYDKSSTLADKFGKCISNAMGITEKYQIMTRKSSNGNTEYYGVLRGARAAGCPNYFIFEHGFHSNYEVSKWLMDNNNLLKLAKSEAKMIAEHYGYSKSNDNNTSTTLPTTPSVKYDENVKSLQRALNLSYGVGLAEDGLFGSRTESAIKNHYLKAVKANEHARLVQTWFKSLGYNIDIDGSYGNNSANVCKEFQKSKGLTVDGVAGLDTHKALIKALKEDKDNHIYYRVITGSYTERANANEEVEKLKTLGYNPFLVAFEKDGVTYLRVVALSTNDRSEADKHVANLKAKGYSAFISVFTK